ncbi:MAG: tetratricopeptide repeat protein [Alphaproteobacteria bacterium]|nr:tetratricopeptide repeat protein [Alphaproteobacteria bacterium]
MTEESEAGGFDSRLVRGRELHRAGRVTEADAIYAELAAIDRNHPDLLFLLGIRAHQSGRHEEAIGLIEQAIARNGSRGDFWRNLATIRNVAGDRVGALQAAERAVGLDGTSADAWGLFGALLLTAGNRRDEAETALRRAVSLDPAHVEARSDLAVLLVRSGRFHEAEGMFRGLLADRPGFAPGWHNWAYALWEEGRSEEALAAIGRACELSPDTGEYEIMRGMILQGLGRIDEATALYRDLIAHDPAYAEAHWSLARALLLKGRCEEGWREHEWRWRRGEMAAYRREWPMPQWDGSPLGGRSIVLHAEQGLGDAIQFMRYVPLVRSAGAGRIILECEKKMHALFAAIKDIDQLIETGAPFPRADAHCPLLSLPLAFGTTLETIPAPVRYLAADSRRVADWAKRLATLPRPRVGLCWQGNPNFKADKLRSVPFAALEPFLRDARASFVRLQKNAGENHPANSEWVGRIAAFPDMDQGPDAFADTAAIMENLDLIVTSDTAVAHLAGALGRPVWMLTAFAPDWRWLLGREDSPWYPSMRLFRQTRPAAWSDAVGRLIASFAQVFPP